MKVFFLPHHPAQAFFYHEDETAVAPPPRHEHGFRGWLERTMSHTRDAFRHPSSRLGRTIKRGWDWMQSRMHPDESLLAGLRSASAVEVLHGPSRSGSAVRAAWDAYLASRRRRHLLWLLFDGTLSPLSLLLAPLPGPNVIGYWFAYRAVRHLLILLGIRRATSGRVEVTFRPVAELDEMVNGGRHPGNLEGAAQAELIDGLNRAAATGEVEAPAAAVAGTVTEDGTQHHATAELQHTQGDRRP